MVSPQFPSAPWSVLMTYMGFEKKSTSSKTFLAGLQLSAQHKHYFHSSKARNLELHENFKKYSSMAVSYTKYLSISRNRNAELFDYNNVKAAPASHWLSPISLIYVRHILDFGNERG